MEQLLLDDYSIYIGNVTGDLSSFLQNKDYSNIIIIVDENTEELCLPILASQIDISSFLKIKIPAGENHKNIQTCQYIWNQLMANNIGRRALCINLGGGVIGDMGGFAASTYKRGIDFVQVPTTLLSQVDASIGGKLGIDYNHVKNSIGVFKNPKAVFIDPVFYKTLPKEEMRSGFAEIIKHSLISDEKQWNQILSVDNLDEINWLHFLIPSLKIKKNIVAQDPFEKGLRKALNFGHTIGHAIESTLLETPSPLLHGEAVAAGIICESYIAHKISGLSLKNLNEISGFIIKIFGKTEFSSDTYPRLIRLMKKDKKNERSEINFTLLKKPGTAIINQTCDQNLITESLDYYRNIPANNSVIR